MNTAFPENRKSRPMLISKSARKLPSFFSFRKLNLKNIPCYLLLLLRGNALKFAAVAKKIAVIIRLEP